MLKQTILIIILTSFILQISAREKNQAITIGKKYTIHSKILNEDRPYWIYLPESYHDTNYTLKNYPVLYLLNGGSYFQSASGVVQFMSSSINANIQIPELIIVAIPDTNPVRDLTPSNSIINSDGKKIDHLKISGGGNAFLRFIKDELFPEIEKNYRTLSYRILAGHAFGGLLTIYSLLDVPGMFQSYIAMNPNLWWHDQLLLRRVKKGFKNPQKPSGSLYISLANKPDIEKAKLQENTARGFIKSFTAVAPRQFRSTLQYFSAEGESSVALLSLYHGLLYIFDGYKPPDEFYKKSLSLITTHFQRVSKRLGVTFLPPEITINQLGYYLLYEISNAELFNKFTFGTWRPIINCTIVLIN